MCYVPMITNSVQMLWTRAVMSPVPRFPPIIPRFPEYWKISGKNLKISKKIRKFQRKQNNLGENLKKGKFSFIFILFGCVFKKLYFYSIYSTKNSSLKSCWFGITLKFFIPQFPDSPTRFPEEWLSIPHSPRNEKIAFLDSPRNEKCRGIDSPSWTVSS